MAKGCPALFLFRTDGIVVPIRCGMWSCAHCRRALAAKWAMRTYNAIAQTDGAYFLTFTLWGSIRTPAEGYAKIPGYWDRLRKRFQRRLDVWTYIAFCEPQTKTRGGMPHFHVITNEYPFTERIKDLAPKCGFGYQADKVAVNSKLAAYYVAKYVAKSDKAMPRGFRRVRCSQNFPELPDLNADSPAAIARFPHENEISYISRCALELNQPAPLLARLMMDAQAQFASVS